MRQWVLDAVNTIDITPESMFPVDGAAHTNVGAKVAMVLSAGAAERAQFGIRRPKFWTNGSVQISISYAGSAADATDIGVDVGCLAFAVGDTLATPSYTSETIAGNASAAIVATATFTTELAVTAADELLIFTLKRDAADGSSSALQIYAARLTYYESPPGIPTA